MYLKRILHSNVGKIFMSILLGLGLATLFRKVCNNRNCLVFKAPELSKIKNQVFKFEGKWKQMLDGGGGVPGTSVNVLTH